MLQTVLSWIWLGSVVWLILRAIRQRKALRRLPTSSSRESPLAPAVTIIVPARNESSNIRPCVESLVAQRYPAQRLSIIVVDDNSEDDTAAIVALLQRGDRRITLLNAPVLAPGWKGKVQACWVGARGAPEDTDWLCFVDADMRAQPMLISSAVTAANTGAIDLLSLAPRHDLGSVAERLILPCGMYLLAFSQDLVRVQSPESTEAVATGQFMLVRRSVYELLGGHAAVRTEICEDLALARLFKRQGYRVLMQDGSALLGTRMYTGWQTLRPGIAKNLIETFGGLRRTVLTTAIAVAMAWAAVLLPLVDALECQRGGVNACRALIPALAGTATAVALHVAGAVHFGIPLWYGLLFPVGYSVGAFLALESLRWRILGRVAWKGRIYQ
jgi:chlorobactene glucosyltransferase